MSLFQRRSGGPFPEPIVNPFPGVSVFGGPAATMASALANDAVWACVRLLAESVSMMPLHAYTIRDGRRVPIADPVLLTSPAAFTTSGEWVYQMLVSLLLRGNAYGQVLARDGMGYPTQVEIVDPDTVAWVRKDDKTWGLRVGGVEQDRTDVFHVRAYPVPGQPAGLSPIKYAAARALGLSAAAAAFGEGFFTQGAHPTAVITTDQPLNETQARTLKDRILASIRGREPAVIGGPGIKWAPMQIAPEESQFLETQKLTVTQIARVFGVPAEMIGGEASNSMTYANVTQRAMDFLTYAVQPWLTRLEAAISGLLPAQRHVRFDTSVLVRLDALTQAQVDEIRLNTGVRVVNEVRTAIDAPPVEWGDEPYLPGIKTAAAAAAIKADSDGPAAPVEGDALGEGSPDGDTI